MPTRQEKDERRKNRLCIWCGVKFTRGHSCLKTQLYQLLLENEQEGEEDNDVFVDCDDPLVIPRETNVVEDNLVISLHALIGTNGYHTMHVQGKIRNQLVSILVDTRSTHNFVDQNIVRKAGVKLNSVSGMIVTVANGEKLLALEMVSWSLLRGSRSDSNNRFLCTTTARL